MSPRPRRPRRCLLVVLCLLLAAALLPAAAADPPPGSALLSAAPAQAAPPKPKGGSGTKREKMQTTAPSSGAAAPATTTAGFNTLESAAIDPDTGAIEFYGHVDPSSKAEAIPYPRVLREALQNPGPQFSLDSDFSGFTRAAIAGKSMDQLLYTADRQLTPFGRVTLQVLKLAPSGTGAHATDLNGLALRSAGFSLAAELRDTLPEVESRITPKTLGRWIEILGLVPEYQTFTEALKGDAAARAEASDTFYQALLQGLAGSLSDEGSEIPAAYRRARAAGTPPDPALKEAIVVYRQQIDALIVPAISVLLERHHLPAVTYSSADLEKAFGAAPVSRPHFVQLDGTTELARLLYEGDVALKSVPFDPALASVDGYRTFPKWADSYIAAEDLGASRDTRYWITADTVEIKESPDGSVASFGAVRLKVESRSKGSDEPWSAERIDPRTKAYADELSARFDAIAARTPALQRLREAAKVVALANWLRGKKVQPALEGGVDPWQAPQQVSGFLAMMPYQRGKRVLWGVWPSGGVDLDLGAKIVVTQDPTLSRESLKARAGGASSPPAPPDPKAERIRWQLRPVDGRGLTTTRAAAEKRKIELQIDAANRIQQVLQRHAGAKDAVAVLNDYLLQTQKEQARELRAAGEALAQAADALEQVDRDLAQFPAADRDALLGNPAPGALQPPPGRTRELADRAKQVLPETRLLDPESYASFDPGRLTDFDRIAGEDGLAPLATGVAGWAARLFALEAQAPDAGTDLPRRSAAFQPFLEHAAEADLQLFAYGEESRTVAALLPNLGYAFQTEAALQGLLEHRVASIEAGRAALDSLRR